MVIPSTKAEPLSGSWVIMGLGSTLSVAETKSVKSGIVVMLQPISWSAGQIISGDSESELSIKTSKVHWSCLPLLSVTVIVIVVFDDIIVPVSGVCMISRLLSQSSVATTELV